MAAKTRTFKKGEEIFSEGQWAEIAYVVKTGRVEIFLQRGSRKTILGTMGPGSCFGEMAPILGGRRSASARAMQDTLCIEINAQVLQKMVENSDAMMRAIVLSLVERVKRLNRHAGYEIRYDNAIVTCANGLVLLADAKPTDPELEPNEEVRLEIHETVLALSKISGRSRGRINDLLKHMAELHLLRISGTGPTADLVFNRNKILNHASGLAKVMDEDKLEKRMAALDTLNLDEISEILNQEPGTVWQQLLTHPNLPELLRFQFQPTVNWLGGQDG